MDPVAAAALNQLVIPLLALILTPIVTIFAHRLLRLAEDKWGVKVSADDEAKLDALLDKGIHFAEAKAKATVKADPSIAPTTGRQKLLGAIDFVRREAQAVGLGQLAEERIAALLQAKFGQLTVEGALTPPPKEGDLPAPLAAMLKGLEASLTGAAALQDATEGSDLPITPARPTHVP